MLVIVTALVLIQAASTQVYVGEEHLCLWPVIELKRISCSIDSHSLVYIESVKATRLHNGKESCIAAKNRGALELTDCDMWLTDSTFYYQKLIPSCHLMPSCTLNAFLPSAIVVVGPMCGNDTDVGTERNLVLIRWGCIAGATAVTMNPGNNTLLFPTTNESTVTNDSNSNHSGTPPNDLPWIIAVAVVINAVIAISVLAMLARQGLLYKWSKNARIKCCGEQIANSGTVTEPRYLNGHEILNHAVLMIGRKGVLYSTQVPLAVAGPPADSGTRITLSNRKVSSTKKNSGNQRHDQSDMEVEVDANDDYQSIGCEIQGSHETSQCNSTKLPPPPAKLESESTNDTLTYFEAKLGQLTSVSTVSEIVEVSGSEGGACCWVPPNRPAQGKHSQNSRINSKTSRRREYEQRWNQRYQYSTETETDERLPPPPPPPHVLDPCRRGLTQELQLTAPQLQADLQSSEDPPSEDDQGS